MLHHLGEGRRVNVSGAHSNKKCSGEEETAGQKQTCLMKEMTLWVPYLSMSGKLISSQNNTSHFPSWTGAKTTPLGVRLYSQ